MQTAVSERISLHACPRCGRPAAVGWSSTARADAQPAAASSPGPEAREEKAVEFDCLSGCTLSQAELHALTHRHR